MHGFFPRRRNLEDILGSLQLNASNHGRALRAIGERQNKAQTPFRSGANKKVRLSDQSAKKNSSSSISYSKGRELITHGKNWKLTLSKILTPTQKINNVCRNSRRNPAQRARLSNRKPPDQLADFNDGEVSWGRVGAANSSETTVLNESSFSSSLNNSTDAERIREIVRKQRSKVRNRNSNSPVEGRSRISEIARRKLARKSYDFRPDFPPSSKMPEAANSRSDAYVSGVHSRQNIIADNTTVTPNNWKGQPPKVVLRSAGRSPIMVNNPNEAVSANVALAPTTVAQSLANPTNKELTPQQSSNPMKSNAGDQLSATSLDATASSAVVDQRRKAVDTSTHVDVSMPAVAKADTVDAQSQQYPNSNAVDNTGPVYESRKRTQVSQPSNSNPNPRSDPNSSNGNDSNPALVSQQIMIPKPKRSKPQHQHMERLRQQLAATRAIR